MRTGSSGTFVISWSQTELDGIRAAPLPSLIVGAQWRWWGEAVRVDGPSGLLVLHSAEGEADLRRRAARAVRRLIGAAGFGAAAESDPDARPEINPYGDAGVPEQGFVVTDGLSAWQVTVIAVEGSAARLLMFTGDMPPPGRELWVVNRTLDGAEALTRGARSEAGVICFTTGTLVDTPQGPRPVEQIRAGDRLWTRDDGAQQVIWTGSRRMTGARLYAMPELRPIRIRRGAMGEDRPEADLFVSPRHRMLLRGPAALALFNTPEVLVAAGDMIDGARVHVDHSLREVTYVHLLLERHQIIRANGLETESFHPANAALDMLDPAQRRGLAALLPGVEADPRSSYGDYARRNLSAPEAAILRHEAA